MRDLYFPCIPRSTRSFIAFEGMAPRGDHLPLTCFSRKNHLGNTPFGHYLLPPLSATLLRELSRGTPSSKECPSEGGVMTVYRIRLKERLDQPWSAWLSELRVSLLLQEKKEVIAASQDTFLPQHRQVVCHHPIDIDARTTTSFL